MKNFYPALLLLFTLIGIQIKNTAAQHEYDTWYFGSNAGMDFTSGAPTNLINGQLNTTEGNATISDAAGNLLFYTDGITVYNKLHNVMVNGTGLHGGSSSTQSALILKQPGSDSLYYIFTAGEAQANGLQYSIVDMSLQSGDGEVIVKNSALLNNTTEKLTAARDSNNIDYWVLTHEIGNNHFDAFKFTASGVNPIPVTSAVGTIHNNEIGYMRCSHSGSKIAVAIHGYNFELMDFDKATGMVSNSLTLTPPPSGAGPYGVEFSPNDSVLYGTIYTPGVILQWDLSSNINSVIAASQLAVDTSANNYTVALQLAPDGKIYVAKYIDYYLGVINNPNIYGTGCNYTDNGFDLFPKQSQLGLPNIFPGFFKQSSSAPAFAVSDTTICEKFCIDFFDSSANNPASWLWVFPGGNPATSTDQNPVNVCYQNPGVFDVTLITTDANGNSDTLTLPDYITVYTNPFAPVITQTGNILSSSPATSYQWQLNSVDIPGATNQSYTILQSGLYTVIIGDENGCNSQASIDASLVGISEVEENSFVNIFPNPSSGDFIVEFFNAEASENGLLKIDVVNTLGQTVFSAVEKISSTPWKKKIELDDVARGIFFIEIKTKNVGACPDFIGVRKKIVIAK